MKISTRGRYGLRAVIDLAMQEEKGCVSLAEIAARQDISFNYLESIFSYLRRAGIVIGTAGSLGGYTLSKTAVEMNLYDILKVLEGELSITGSEEPENERFTLFSKKGLRCHRQK
ncbi:MAG: RrF2 family transcriptional regulator [Acutalibacteraceae bacterium]